MFRRPLAVATLVAAVVFLGTGCNANSAANPAAPASPTAEPAIKGPAITLKVQLPQEDATVWVNGKEQKGTGVERELRVAAPARGKQLLVKTLWEPNNYTKITRRYKLSVKPGARTVALDLRKPNPEKKDEIVVRYVPTPDDIIEAMCKMGAVGKNDVVYDLGCGDGRIVITAIKRYGAKRGVGMDIDPERIKECKENAETAGVTDKVKFSVGNVLKLKPADIADATVVMLYMGDDIDLRLRPLLRKTLKPGARVISHRFTMGDWKPDLSKQIDPADETKTVHVWRITKDTAAQEKEDFEDRPAKPAATKGKGEEESAVADEAKAKSVRLKVLVPEEDARVWVNGKEFKGAGEERFIRVPPLAEGKDHYLVKALIEPNNYTKITRKRKVAVKPGDTEATADLRKQDLKHPDDIVVRYVPTPEKVVAAMCKLGKIGPNDVVYDLGCGDGRMVIMAVKDFHARRGVGVDLDPERIKESKENADKAGVGSKVEFRVGDVLKIKDLHDATVVLLYMGDDIDLRLRPILKKTLPDGARIVSHRFKMGDWRPDRSITVQDEGEDYHLHLWTIHRPQQPAGTREKLEANGRP
jgi:uncharacterized protein (TIGR03000 family)